MDQAIAGCVADERHASVPTVLYDSVEEAARVNRRRIEQNVAFFRANPEGLDERICELDEEWDVERVLQVAAGAGALAGFWLSFTRSRLWLLAPLLIVAGELHHGLTRQSPAAALCRRLGFRMREEIDAEAGALRALRGNEQ